MLTVGHGEAPQEKLTALLVGAGVRLVVDVRRFPGSRRSPHFAKEELERWLPAAGVAYRWEPRLGGRRRQPPEEFDADPWWQVPAFRAYAAHTRTAEFGEALADLERDVLAEPGSVAVMCSESLWWRCHRRLIADVSVLLHHRVVQHLAHDGRLTQHVPSAGARATPQGLRWDVVE